MKPTTAERINALIEEAGHTAKVEYDSHLVGDESGIRLSSISFGTVTAALSRRNGLPEGTLELRIGWSGASSTFGFVPVTRLAEHTDACKKALSFAKRLGKLAYKANEEAYAARAKAGAR